MALETGSYISDLNSANPAGTDNIANADNHIRLIKATLLATFPNITGAITPSHTTINGWEARIAAVEASYIKKDGSVAMTGALNMGSKKITSLLDPTGAQDAATKTYVDTADAAEVTARNTAIQALYPVGSLYFNASDGTNPGTLLGFGTWVAFAAGRVVVGAGTSSEDDNAETQAFTAGDESGEFNVTLTQSQIPSHKHKSGQRQDSARADETWVDARGSVSAANGYQIARSGTGSGSGIVEPYTDSVGGGGSHTNIQPNIAVYIWKRTA